MTNIDKIFTRLSHLVKMDSKEDIAEFERIIWDLAATNDPIIISKLISLFDDNCPHPEVMYSLVHAIEQCEVHKYVPIVITKIEEGVRRYPMWIDSICSAIFNEPVCLELFKTHLHLTTKKALLQLLTIMEQDSSHHREIIAELRAELEKQK